jgi:hypothetical protein
MAPVGSSSVKPGTLVTAIYSDVTLLGVINLAQRKFTISTNIVTGSKY